MEEPAPEIPCRVPGFFFDAVANFLDVLNVHDESEWSGRSLPGFSGAMVCHPLQIFMQMDGTHGQEIRSGSNRGARAVRAG